MKNRLFIFTFLLLTLTLSAQELSLTVYNQNLALVREQRTLGIKSGVSDVSYADVASQIDPTSVHFKSLTSPGNLAILEQNYEYDLVDAAKIMRKYIDQEIRIVLREGDVYEGKLLSVSGRNVVNVVIREKGGSIKIVREGYVQHFEFPELPDGLITRPTLVWTVDNQGSASQQTELSYLTGGVNWHAEYVAVASADDTRLGLSGWVSIENQSGAIYKDARLKLVAGDVNLTKSKSMKKTSEDRYMAASFSPPQFEEKSFFEYHLYTLQRLTTLKNNQTKQIALFPSAQTDVEKVYVYEGVRHPDKIRVHMTFKNSKAAGLGMPLPKGKIRVYKEDDDGALEFIGEDQIDHTPRDEKVRIFLGNAFDLKGERVQKSAEKTGARSRKESYEITLRNHKDEAVVIVVDEHFRGDWSITDQTHEYDKKDALTAEFKIEVPPDGEVILEYTVRLKW